MKLIDTNTKIYQEENVIFGKNEYKILDPDGSYVYKIEKALGLILLNYKRENFKRQRVKKGR